MKVKVVPHRRYLNELKDNTLVCGQTSYFPDDVHAKCDVCGEGIVFRPYNQVAKEKICTGCFMKRSAKPDSK